MSPFGISKILEIKDVAILRAMASHKQMTAKECRRRKLKEYALVGEDNVIHLLNINTFSVQKLLSAESKAIGMYYDR